MKTVSWVSLAGGAALGASALAAVRRLESPGDTRLEERVRNELLELASFPSAIDVRVRDATVELSGSVLPRDHVRVVQGVLSIPGVQTVHDQLYLAETAHEDRPTGGIGWPRSRARKHARMVTTLLAFASASGLAALLARGAAGALLASFGAVLAAGALSSRGAPEPRLVLEHPLEAPPADQVGYGLLP